MTDRDDLTAADSATETHHEPAEHGGAEALGPVDVPAWTAGALGVALGLVVVLCMVVARGGLGT